MPTDGSGVVDASTSAAAALSLARPRGEDTMGGTRVAAVAHGPATSKEDDIETDNQLIDVDALIQNKGDRGNAFAAAATANPGSTSSAGGGGNGNVPSLSAHTKMKTNGAGTAGLAKPSSQEEGNHKASWGDNSVLSCPPKPRGAVHADA